MAVGSSEPLRGSLRTACYPLPHGHWMTFFDLAVGGGEEIGGVDEVALGGCCARFVGRVRVNAALWFRAGLGAGATSFGSAAARVTRSARGAG